MEHLHRQARILHLALAAAAFFTLGTFALVRRMAGVVALEGRPATMVGLGAVAATVLAFGLTAVLARRLERDPAEADDVWRRRAISTLVTIWATAEAAVLATGVAWLLTGRVWLAAVAVAGMMLFLANSPGRRLS